MLPLDQMWRASIFSRVDPYVHLPISVIVTKNIRILSRLSWDLIKYSLSPLKPKSRQIACPDCIVAA